jgi:hypothetical protein
MPSHEAVGNVVRRLSAALANAAPFDVNQSSRHAGKYEQAARGILSEKTSPGAKAPGAYSGVGHQVDGTHVAFALS